MQGSEKLIYCRDVSPDCEQIPLISVFRMEEDMKSREINVKVHDHCGSKRERRLAKEKAVQR